MKDTTAAELWNTQVAFTAGETARLLRLTYQRGTRKGDPDRRKVINLVNEGRLRPIDGTQPWWRWSFSKAELQRFIGVDSKDVA